LSKLTIWYALATILDSVIFTSDILGARLSVGRLSNADYSIAKSAAVYAMTVPNPSLDKEGGRC